MKKRVICTVLLGMLSASLVLNGCTGTKNSSEQQAVAAEEKKDSEGDAEDSQDLSGAPTVTGLQVTGKMDLSYAESFEVYDYSDGYQVIVVKDSDSYLVVPEGKEVPEGAENSFTVLKKPLDCVYLAATSAMSLYDALGAVDEIKLSGTQQEGWYIDSAVEAMKNGTMTFAGKYSEPDYELLLDKGCNLAVESTMILHSPKIKEMLEKLDIPVFVDHSSFENHPLGRTEWIKAYGVLTGKEDQANQFFDEQKSVVEELGNTEKTGKTIAYFYISGDGLAVVRSEDDYIPKMIEIAGGEYAFQGLKNEEGSASVKLSMEEFYATAVDADYIIYNSSIDSPLNSMEDLYSKSELFKEFKAVKEGNVWCTGKSLYQATDIVGQMIGDIHTMLQSGDESEMTFLYHVK